MFRTLLFVLALSLVACGREEPTGPGPGAPVAALPDWAKVSDAQRAAAREAQVPVAFENSIGMRFVLIPAGTFRMGSPETENGRDDNETLHEVVVSRPFYLGVTEVTNGEFRRFRSSHDSWSHLGDRLQGERQPVVGVVWDDAMAFTKWLTDRVLPASVHDLRFGTG